MRRTKKANSNPYGKQIIELVPVSEHENGNKVWFAKMPITPDTNPVDVQDLQRKQARVTSLLFVAANKVAVERNIPPEDARALFFPQRQEDGTETVPLNFIDYLSQTQMEEFLMLQSEAAGLPIACATMFLKRRLAFELTLSDAVENGYYIETPWFDITAGDKFKFDSNVVTVAKIDDDIVYFNDGAVVKPNTTGFLLDDKGEYLLGDESWTEEQTKSMLSIQQIDAIYRFYDECLNAKSEGKQKQRPSKTSENMPTVQPSIGGEMSTQSAVLSESQPKTIDSPTETLAIVQ